MYFGGIWGGQLQRWNSRKYVNESKTDLEKDDQPAIALKVALLNSNMLGFAEQPKDIKILAENGKDFLFGNYKRFFEAA